MQNNYNMNMYLTPSNLNTIENTIESITTQIQENIFIGQTSELENIQVGDNLSGKTLYLSFPRNAYENITSRTTIDIIKIDNNTKISYVHNSSKRYVYVKYKGISYYIYIKVDYHTNPYLNFVRYVLPVDFGVVSEINSNSSLYQYIGIYHDENIIPNYVKSSYNVNDVPTMKQIDNIERGIENIGNYYYKPVGFVGNREWLGTAELGKDNKYGTNMQNLSYQDLNRWISNLSSINFDNLNTMTFWNSEVSEIDWYYDNDTEWEEF